MLTFIYYEKEELLHQHVKTMLGDSELVEFTLEPSNTLTLVNEINSIDIFGTPKTYVIHGANFFQIKSHKFKKKELPILIDTLKNSRDQIIITLTKAINFKNVHVNSFTERNYIDLSDEKKVSNHYIAEFIQNNNINIDDQQLLALKYNLDNNFLLLKNELLKLANYTNFQAITSEVINQFGVKTVESNAFDLLGLILTKDITRARHLYEDITNEGTNPVSTLGLLSSQIRFSYQVKMLSDMHSAGDIASLLKANPYRVKITLNNLNKVSIHQINAFYLNCAKIDFLIKSGRLNQELIFDYLIY